MKMTPLLVVAILVVAPTTILGLPAVPTTNDNDKNNEAPPGSAGHHGSVQSGQFLITNNENYGLQYSPYTAPDKNQPQHQALTQQQPEHRATNYNDGGAYCAGCMPLTTQTSETSQSQFHIQLQNQNQLQGSQPMHVPVSTGLGYALNLQQRQQQKPWNQNQQQPEWNQQQPQWTQQPQPWNQQKSAWNQQQNAWNQQQQPWGAMGQQQQPWGTMGWQQQPWSDKGQQQQFNRDPATVQHMQLNNDGQYSFSYNAADSSRQEQRNLDGSVLGSYAYTDPSGRQVQVDYRATPNEGYQAFGPTVPLQTHPNHAQSPMQVIHPHQQLPLPVQDTPEVQAARAQFFTAYNQQLQLIKQEQEAAAARAAQFNKNNKNMENGQSQADKDLDASIVTVYSENANNGEGQNPNEDSSKNPDEPQPIKSLASASDFKNLPDPIPIPDSNAPSHAEVDEDDELESDAVVITRNDDSSLVPSDIKATPESQANMNKNMGQTTGPEASYQLSIVLGADGQAHQQAFSVPVPATGPGGNMGQGQNFQMQMPTTQSNPQAFQGLGPSYQISQVIGGGPGQMQFQSQPRPGQQVQMGNNYMPMNGPGATNSAMVDQKTRSGLPAYFYYVSVGGSPHYVTSNNLFRSEVPTSLKAHLVGAIPLSAVHDAQVPNAPNSMGQLQVQNQNQGGKYSAPVYLELDKMPQNYNSGSKQSQTQYVVGFIPGTIVSLRNDAFTNAGASTGANVQNKGQGQQNPSFNYPYLLFRNE